MSLETKKSLEQYDGNGVTTAFPFAFKVWDAAHVKVYANVTGEQEDVTESVTIALTDGGAAGGTVTFSEPPAMGTRIAIARKMPFIQEDRYVSGNRIDPHELEDRLDQDCAERQELRDAIDRCVKTSETSYQTVDDLMNAVEENAVLVEKTKDECLAALEEIREANYAPLSTVEEMAETLSGVSNVADGAAQNASSALDAINTLEDAVATAGSTADSALDIANQALDIATAGITYKGEVATTGDLPSGADAGDIYTVTADGKLYISDGAENWAEFNAVSVDQSIIASSANPVAGGAVKTALDAKADDSAVMKLAGAQDVTAKKTWTTANTGPEVTNTGNTLKVSLRSSDTPRAGIYDVTNSEWLIRRNGDGSFTLTAKAGGVTKSLQGTAAGALTWGGADITGDVKKAMLPLNPKLYGAVGDGSTNDTVAFTSLETAHQGKIVDLLGCTYVVNSSFDKNTYVNGALKIGGVTINKFAEIVDMHDEIQTGSSSVITEVKNPDRASGTWVTGVQGFACRGTSMYVLQHHQTNASGTTVQDPKILRYTFDSSGNAVFADASSVSPALGHQGVAVDNTGKIITGWSNNNSQDIHFIGRFTYTKNTVISPTKIRLFPSSYTGSLSPTPTMSRDKRWLVAQSKNANDSRVIRIWDYQAMSGTDWSNLHTREFMIPDVPSSPATQAIMMDENRIYIVCGDNSLAKNKHLYVYDTMGRLLYKNTSIQIGYSTADDYASNDGVFEPQGLNWINDGEVQRIGFMFVCGPRTGVARHVYISRFTA